MRKDEEYVGGRLIRMHVDERRKGRPKRRWMDSVNVDLREKGLSGEETQNQAVSRQLVRNIDPRMAVQDAVVEEGKKRV